MENEILSQVHHVLFLLISIFLVGMISGKIASWLKIPDVVVFLLAGITIGPVFHLVHETSSSFTNQFILTLGSVLILFDGGRNIRISTLRKVWISVAMLSVPGVLITLVVVGYSAYMFLGIPLEYCFLLAAIIASTDPATLIPVFKQVQIKPKVRETVESESAFNDATGSIVTFSILAIIAGTAKVTLMSGVIVFLKAAGGGILVGALVSFVLAYLVAHLHLGVFRDYTTIAMVVVGIGSYQIADYLGFSGFMATFVAGLVWGNVASFGLKMEDKLDEMGHFTENITVLMRMLIFILLGSQVDFQVIVTYFLPSFAIIMVFMFIARPLTVLLSVLPDRRAKWKWNEIVFMFWVRETGVIPAALSGLVVGMGITHADVIASVTFMAILITILLQGSTTAYVARKLKIEHASE